MFDYVAVGDVDVGLVVVGVVFVNYFDERVFYVYGLGITCLLL
jgi:hypothetical protein